MARSTLRRQTPSLEHLESRMVLSSASFGPDHAQTLMIDTLSRMRQNPAEAAEWVEQNADALVKTNIRHYGIDLGKVRAEIASAAPRQPLAYSPELSKAAQGHSDDMARNNFQSHQGSDGRSLGQRLDSAGYSGRTKEAENAFAYADSLDQSIEGFVNNAMEAFMIDWGVADAGHRKNIQEPDDHTDSTRSDEVGVGLSRVDQPVRDRVVVVQNFGSRAETSGQLVGVVYEDLDGNGRLSYEEGRGSAEIKVRNLDSKQTQTVRPWQAGMYQIPLQPGRYEVSLEVDGRVLDQQPLQMSAANQKIDFNLTALRGRGQTFASNTKADQEAPKQAPATRSQPGSEAPVVSLKANTNANTSTNTSKEKQDTQMITDLLSSGLLSDLSSLNIASSSTWRAR